MGRNLRQEMLDKVMQRLQAGVMPWQRAFSRDVALRMVRPHNPVSGVFYRGINRLALSMAQEERGYSDARWLTMRQLQQIALREMSGKGFQPDYFEGRDGFRRLTGFTHKDTGERASLREVPHVRKGERASVVEFWKLYDERESGEVDAETGRPRLERVRAERPSVFHAYVFNAEQIENMPPAQRAGMGFEPVRAAELLSEAFLQGTGVVLDHGLARGEPAYMPLRDGISMPPKESFLTSEGYYATLLHELGHATGHPGRLAREFHQRIWAAHESGQPIGKEESAGLYAREELVAELSSYFTLSALGIDAPIESHASYLKHWLDALQNDRALLARAAAQAELASDYLLKFAPSDTLRETESAGLALEHGDADLVFELDPALFDQLDDPAEPQRMAA